MTSLQNFSTRIDKLEFVILEIRAASLNVSNYCNHTRIETPTHPDKSIISRTTTVCTRCVLPLSVASCFLCVFAFLEAPVLVFILNACAPAWRCVLQPHLCSPSRSGCDTVATNYRSGRLEPGEEWANQKSPLELVFRSSLQSPLSGFIPAVHHLIITCWPS